MEKRFQVFVSSTYEDLKDERREVMEALLELDCIPSGMELFPAADDDQWTVIRKIIDNCDYYIVIIGWRYGSTGPSGKSYTQMEYEYAVDQGKPVIAFLHNDINSVPASKVDKVEKKQKALEAFRELVQKKMCKHWTNSAQLSGIVTRSIINLIKTKPAAGWVRADLIPDEAASKEISRLNEIVEQLSQEICLLDEYPEDMHSNIEEAKILWLSGVSMLDFLQSNYSTFERKLKNGQFINALVVNPNGNACELAASRDIIVNIDYQKSRINTTLQYLASLKEQMPDKMEIRIIDNPLDFEIVLADLGGSNKTMYLRHLGFKTTLGAEPKMMIPSTNSKWFDYFEAHIQNLWKSGTAWGEI